MGAGNVCARDKDERVVCVVSLSRPQLSKRMATRARGHAGGGGADVVWWFRVEGCLLGFSASKRYGAVEYCGAFFSGLLRGPPL